MLCNCLGDLETMERETMPLQRCLQIVQKMINTAIRPCFLKVVYEFVPEDKLPHDYNFGVKYNGDTLVIQSKKYLDGILFREALWSIFPAQVRELVESKDIAWEFARLNLTNEKRKEWHELWQSVAKSINLNGFKLFAPTDFPIYNKLSNGSFIEQIVKSLLSFKHIGIPITKKSYLKILQDNISNVSYNLDEDDIHILNTFTKNLNKSFRDISKMLNLSYRKLIKKINFYRKYRLLRTVNVIFPTKLGFRNYVVIIRGITLHHFFKEFKKSPFLYSYVPLISADGGVVAIFNIPKNKYNIIYFRDKMDELSKVYNVTLMNTHLRHHNYNFKFYDVNSKKWQIPWVSLFEGLVHDIENKEMYKPSVAYSLDERDELTKEIDTLDLRILKYLSMCDLSLRKLREALNINMNTLISRVKRLEELGLFKKGCILNHIGLNKYIFIYMIAKEPIYNSYLKLVDQLPHHVTGIHIDASQQYHITSMLHLPYVEIPKFSSYLRNTIENYVPHLEIYSTDGYTYGPFTLHEVFWDNEHKRWNPYPASEEEIKLFLKDSNEKSIPPC